MFRIEVQAVANFSLFTIHFSLNERFGVSLTASRRFAVSDTACCSFLTMTSEVQGERRAELARAMLSRSLHSRCISNASQRYYIFIAVYEYNGRFYCLLLILRQYPGVRAGRLRLVRHAPWLEHGERVVLTFLPFYLFTFLPFYHA